MVNAKNSPIVKTQKGQELFGGQGNDDVLETLATFFGLPKSDIEAHSRKKDLVEARHIIMYILRKYGGMSFLAIGKLIGNRDHTTVIHACNKTEKRFKENPSLEATLDDPIALARALRKRRLKVEKEIKEMNARLNAETMEKIRNSRFSGYVLKTRSIQQRDTKILEMYREGLTLQNIAEVFKISRERVRQIVLKTIEYMAVNESLDRGIVMDVDVLVEEEVRKRKKVIEAKKPQRPVKEKIKRWSTYYDACKKCNSTTYPHVRRGLCEQCLGVFRGKNRERIINEHGGTCDSCGVIRPEAMRKYGRDLHIKKDRTVLCRKCFLKRTATELGQYKNYEWSRFHPECKKCGTTETPHASRGLCANCAEFIPPKLREEFMHEHSNKCDRCGLSRDESKKKFKKDLWLTKNREVLCLNCFVKEKYSKH